MKLKILLLSLRSPSLSILLRNKDIVERFDYDQIYYNYELFIKH